MLDDKKSGIGFGWLPAIGLIVIFGVASGTASAQAAIKIEPLNVNGTMYDYTLNTILMRPGETFTISAPVKNKSEEASLKLKMVAKIGKPGASDFEFVKRVAVGRIRAGKTKTKEVSIQAPSEIGRYTYLVCVSPKPKRDQGNSSQSACEATRIHVSENGLDVVVSSLVSNPSSVEIYDEFEIVMTPKNMGWEAVGGYAILSHQQKTKPGKIDRYLEQFLLPARDGIEPGKSRVPLLPARFLITAPSRVGVHEYQACVGVLGEDKEYDSNNNCAEPILVTVSLPPSVVSDVFFDSFIADPHLVKYRDQTLTLTASFGNQGREPSAQAVLYFYRSTDRIISPEDSQLGEPVSIGTIPAGGTISRSMTRKPNPPDFGHYFYGTCIAVAGDGVEENNCSFGTRVGIKNPIFSEPH